MSKADEKILRWECEIEKNIEAQKEMNERYNKKIKELRLKIENEKRLQERMNGEAILQLVKQIYGDINEETIEKLKGQLPTLGFQIDVDEE